MAVVDLQTGRSRVLVQNGGCPRWSSTGHLLFGHGGLVYAAPFDVRRLEFTGPPLPVLEGVAMWSSPGGTDSAAGNVHYAAAPEGTLIYSPREARLPNRTLVWVDRQGHRTPVTSRQHSYVSAQLSPDGTRIVAGVDVGPGTRRSALILDIRRDAWTRVALDSEEQLIAVTSWMPDAKRLMLYVRQR